MLAPPGELAPHLGEILDSPLIVFSKMDKFDAKFSPSEALHHRSPMKDQIELVQKSLDMSHT